MTDANTGGIAAEKLRSFVERIERLEAEKAELAADIREIYSEAKGTGFDTKIIRQCIKLRKLEAADRREQDELLELYRRALGDLDGTPLGEAALAGSSGKPAKKRAGAGPIAQIRQDIANGDLTIEGGGVRIEADGKGGVQATPTTATRTPPAEQREAEETEPAAPQQHPVVAAADNDDLDMPPGFKGATERQARAAASARAEG